MRCFSPFPHGTGSLSVSYPIFSLTGWSRQIHAEFLVLRATQDTTRLQIASNTQLSCSMAELSRTFFSQFFLPQRGPTTPPMPEDINGLGCSPFARHYLGNHYLFSLPTGTKMFQFPAYAHQNMVCQAFNLTGCPIRKSTDQRSFAPPRGLSQLITSFIAGKSQGIHRTPFSTFFCRIPYL